MRCWSGGMAILSMKLLAGMYCIASCGGSYFGSGLVHAQLCLARGLAARRLRLRLRLMYPLALLSRPCFDTQAELRTVLDEDLHVE